MKQTGKNKSAGFSIVELMVAMTIMLVLLALISGIFARSLSTRQFESSRTDALTSSQAALNVISREVANSGYGIREPDNSASNGLVLTDCTNKRIHIRANVDNDNLTTSEPGEDVTYFYDVATESIVRYDPNDVPQISGVVNRVSEVTFEYFDYTGSSSTPTKKDTPTSDTGRVRINVTVFLEDVQGYPTKQKVTFTSDITLRNSKYMLNQY
jgi:prepilin-type N-terminal cleavage/methylation domain-containing protein